MADPILTVSEVLVPAFAAVGGAGADPVVRPSDRADAQANGALPIAKRLGQNPRQVAEAVLAAAGPALDAICSQVEIAGPGFINLSFSDAFLQAQLADAAADKHLGVRSTPTALRVVIDYSAPNVAKEMHVGHLRSTIIGDALVRLMAFVGHDVVRENHIGDWGRPFGMLIEHLLDVGEAVAREGLEQRDLDAFYKAANAKFNEDPEFAERSRRRVVLLQSGDPETRVLWRRLVDMSAEYFNLIYRKLGVLLTDADLAGESLYQPLMDEVYGRLDKAGLVEESDGAQVVFVPGFTNREGQPLPLMLRSSAGAYTYATSDVACVMDRVERLGADLMLYVVGAPQAQHLQMVFAVCRMAGWLVPPTEAVHVPFGSVLGDDRKMLRSRAGDAVKLSDLLDEAVERAAAAVAAKNPDLAGDDAAGVARMIGIGALKYADLSNDRIKDYVFDWDRMLAFDGNTAPYLQYAHARICSIFRRAEIDRQSVGAHPIVLGEPQERDLAKRLLAFDSAVWDTIDKYSPHRLCTYLFDLAQDFTAFYEHCPVLKADDDATKQSRLALCDFTARALAKGLDLLGIVAPERM